MNYNVYIPQKMITYIVLLTILSDSY